jgi:hypothetical protein
MKSAAIFSTALCIERAQKTLSLPVIVPPSISNALC